MFSPHNSEVLTLYAEGPCGNARLSTRNVIIKFKNCTCPVGFETLSSNTNNTSDTKCECKCDSILSPYITKCNSTTSSVLRVNVNSWIDYINDTYSSGYIIHSNCPFDFCKSSTENVNINFNHPNGADAQCAYNHTGVLCGMCQHNLSLSLGSSRCLPCSSHWPAVLIAIIICAIIAGILLVTALLALNMTVAVGLISSIIFYANIVETNSAAFFPSSEPSFPTVFIAWLNLNVGIDVCFFDGLDSYAKTWLQLAFPIYIISLVVLVIMVSGYFPKFAALIGKKDIVATLATLILLSYAKLLSITVTVLSSAVLHYPDGEYVIVWLPDGNVKFFQGKHKPLAIVALFVIIIGLPYTIFLFLWQWLVRAPSWKIFKWTRSTRLNNFIATYHAPHNSKHRYWTGLLLLFRVVLYFTASVTASSSPQTLPLMTIMFVVGLFLLKGVVGVRVYKSLLVDNMDTVLLCNILTLAAFSLYEFKKDIMKQTAVAYTSVLITFILLVGVIVYHVALLIRKDRPAENLNKCHPRPAESEVPVTHSLIELPKHDQQPPSEAGSQD